MSATVSKGDSDFITALSVLSSTSNIASTSTTPLDIVLVLDASGSMDDDMTGGKRIDALKNAANAFIDEIATQNAEHFRRIEAASGFYREVRRREVK